MKRKKRKEKKKEGPKEKGTWVQLKHQVSHFVSSSLCYMELVSYELIA